MAVVAALAFAHPTFYTGDAPDYMPCPLIGQDGDRPP
jgi:hypothetical protein